jgi:hypothetical protein
MALVVLFGSLTLASSSLDFTDIEPTDGCPGSWLLHPGLDSKTSDKTTTNEVFFMPVASVGGNIVGRVFRLLAIPIVVGTLSYASFTNIKVLNINSG